MPRRKLTDVDRLALVIMRAIRKSKVTPRESVNALLAVAAGRAVAHETHYDCGAFENEAHTAFHAAESVLVVREEDGRLVN